MNPELIIKLFKNIFVLNLFMLLAACAGGTFSGQRPEPVTELSQGQTGRIYFESTNPANYKSIMTRRWLDTRKTVIWGTLTIPPESLGKVSAVIILRNIENKHSFVWARELNEIGLATFVVEVEASRKSHRYDDQRREIHSPTYVADAFAALKLLSTHPAIDADNVAVMGYSKGGHVAHIAASTKIHRLLSKPGLKFAAHVGLYPGCHFTLHDIKMTGAPLLFLMGEKDNKNFPELCERYAERIRKAGFESKVIVYPDAYWGWDQKGSKRTNPGVNTADCYLEFLNNGKVVDLNTGRPMDDDKLAAYMRKCLKKGYTTAYNADVTRKSIEDTKTFLSRVLLGQ